jgi:HAD superfamily hydrolase (TIGR01509 family)
LKRLVTRPCGRRGEKKNGGLARREGIGESYYSGMNFKAPRAILFDFGGTLDADGTPWKERFYPIYREEGVDWDFHTFARLFCAADESLNEEKLHEVDYAGTLLEQVSRVLRGGDRQDDRLARRIAERFHIDSLQCLERNKVLLEELSARYRLGIVSNFYGNLEILCEEIGYRKFFDTVIDSACVGVSKPQPAIFQVAVAKLGCLPEQVLFVGDNPLRDMAPAKALAMPHVWLNTLHPERQACCEDDQVIRSLLDLRKILP